MTDKTVDKDKLANARRQGQAQFNSITEMVEALNVARSGYEDKGDDLCNSFEDAEQAIHEDALSVEVRGDWHTPGQSDKQDDKPAEYRILLTTGGPAVRVHGTLSEHGEPETARLEVQDWFTPWTEFWPHMSDGDVHSEQAEEILLAYARCFWFGE